MLRMHSLGQKLLLLKKELEEKKDARLQLQGELRTLQKQLVEDFNVSNLQEAELLLDEMEKTLAKIEVLFKEGIRQVEELMKERR